MKRSTYLLCGILAAMVALAATVRADDEQVNFSRQIRPLLAENCFHCHGLDEKSREADLRLDTRDGLFAKTEAGDVVIAPGDADKSLIFQKISASDPADRMPPEDFEKKLTPEQIATVKKWIEQGARWDQHWSFVAPQRPPLPEVADAAWPLNEIDRFVLARLEKEGLKPAERADKVTLIRRVTYDLTGLPPTPQEIDAFVADTSDEAFPRLVDRLLESPRYGEHMARYWLDAARYGDTHGLHLDNYREMWPYRDWVIRALNDNMPFDRFTTEQLAGDLLPDATTDQIVATGFNRCNVTTSEGGALEAEYLIHYTNDRVSTVGTVWMGLTLGCAVCHDHKFDPIRAKDFYQLSAFFNSLDGPVMDGNAKNTAPVIKVASDEQREEMTAVDRRIGELASSLAAASPEVDRAQAEWEASLRSNEKGDATWISLAPQTFTSQGGATLSKLEDDSILASGENSAREVYEITAALPAGRFSAVRLEGLTDPSLTEGGAGRSANGNVVLNEFEAEVATAAAPDKFERIKFVRAWADYEQPDGDFKIANAIDGNAGTGWAIGGHLRRENRLAIFLTDKPIGDGDAATTIKVRLRHESVFAQHQFGRVRLSVTARESIPQLNEAKLPPEIAKIVAIDADKRNGDQQTRLREHYRTTISQEKQIVEARDELAKLRKRRTEMENSLPISLVWKDAAKPRPAHVLHRGQYDKPGEEVTRNTPSMLPPLAVAEGQSPTRLDLARWLLSPEHPLTARVTVNRMWQRYFGIGLVETAEDFGTQGTQPSHPELLDWLAVEFRESGWDVKRMQKLIVMSATYQQSSKIAKSQFERDPKNRLLARGPRFRMDAEMVRDTALFASGLLGSTIGGPSVKTYQPPGIWEAVGYSDSNTKNFERDDGAALYRRSMYTFWKRTAPPPVMSTLDAPSRETCTVRRSRTNTPLAALALMNDEQFVEASRRLAERVLLESDTPDDARAAYLFRLATGRMPNEAETAVLLDTFRTHLATFTADEEAAKKLIHVGESKPRDGLDARQVAAWAMVANLVLNLDEAITKS
ncbi:MAG: PSD1 and planctomycete cytochrome C domain-containing protein [Pirellulales bacterium]